MRGISCTWISNQVTLCLGRITTGNSLIWVYQFHLILRICRFRRYKIIQIENIFNFLLLVYQAFLIHRACTLANICFFLEIQSVAWQSCMPRLSNTKAGIISLRAKAAISLRKLPKAVIFTAWGWFIWC